MGKRKVGVVAVVEIVVFLFVFALCWLGFFVRAQRSTVSEIFVQALAPRSVLTSIFSPNSKLLATLEYPAGIAIWDSVTGDLVRTLSDTRDGEGVFIREHQRALAFSQDGEMIALAHRSWAEENRGAAAINVWTIADGRLVHSLPNHCLTDSGRALREIFDMRFSANINRIALVGSFGSIGRTGRSSGDYLEVLLWNLNTSVDGCGIEALVSPPEQTTPQNAATFCGHPDAITNLCIATANDKGAIDVWRVERDEWTRSHTINPPSREPTQVITLVSSPMGDRLVVERTNVAGFRDVEFWHFEDHIAQLDRRVKDHWLGGVSPDGGLVALADTTGVDIESLPSGRIKFRIGESLGSRPSVAFASDGRLIGIVPMSEAPLAKVFDQRTGKLRRALDARRSSQVIAVQFSHDGRILASGDTQGRVALWDHSTGRLLSVTESGKPVAALAFSPDDRFLVTGGTRSHISIWNVVKGRLSLNRTLDWPATSLAFSPHGDQLASGYSGPPAVWARSVMLWSTATWQQVRELTEASKSNYAIAFSPDGNTLATGGSDLMAVSMRDLRTGLERGFLWAGGLVADHEALPVYSGAEDSFEPLRARDTPARSIAFSPNGKLIAVGTEEEMRLHLAETGRRLNRVCCGRFRSIAFAPDGATLATADDGHAVRIWWTSSLVSSESAPKYLNLGYRVDARAIAYSPDGKTLASAGLDGTTSLWDPNNGNLIMSLACLSEHEWVAFNPTQLRYRGSDRADEWLRARISGTLTPIITIRNFRNVLQRSDIGTLSRPDIHPSALLLLRDAVNRVPNMRLWAVGLAILATIPFLMIFFLGMQKPHRTAVKNSGG